MQPNILGWDIGGAHVKVALAKQHRVSQVQQLACPLWKGLDELSQCIHTVENLIEFESCSHAVTMTGELVDHFSDRKHGVLSIIEEVSNKLNASKVKYYAGNDGFIDTQQATAEYKKIASANWLASAHYAAKKISSALFIDIGSTTTDIVTIKDHKVAYTGYTDEERLVAKELVYCGVVRTPIFAICKSALVKNLQIPIINEYFSNTADVYRLTEELAEFADLSDTLDGREKNIVASAARLARMFANDAGEGEIDVWRNVAKQIREAQMQMIKDACRHQFMKKNVPLSIPIIGAGVGRFLIKEIAKQLGRDYIDFEALFEINSTVNEFGVGDCAPAAAVACLATSEISKSHS